MKTFGLLFGSNAVYFLHSFWILFSFFGCSSVVNTKLASLRSNDKWWCTGNQLWNIYFWLYVYLKRQRLIQYGISTLFIYFFLRWITNFGINTHKTYTCRCVKTKKVQWHENSKSFRPRWHDYNSFVSCYQEGKRVFSSDINSISVALGSLWLYQSAFCSSFFGNWNNRQRRSFANEHEINLPPKETLPTTIDALCFVCCHCIKSVYFSNVMLVGSRNPLLLQHQLLQFIS